MHSTRLVTSNRFSIEQHEANTRNGTVQGTLRQMSDSQELRPTKQIHLSASLNVTTEHGTKNLLNKLACLDYIEKLVSRHLGVIDSKYTSRKCSKADKKYVCIHASCDAQRPSSLETALFSEVVFRARSIFMVRRTKRG